MEFLFRTAFSTNELEADSSTSGWSILVQTCDGVSDDANHIWLGCLAILFSGGVFTFMCVLVLIFARVRGPHCNSPGGFLNAMRLSGFVALHLLDWTTNVLAMWIFLTYFRKNELYWLYVFLPGFAQCIIVVCCIYVTVTHADSLNWQINPGDNWYVKLNAWLRWFLAIIFLGVLQLVIVKLAWNNYVRVCEDLARRVPSTSGRTTETDTDATDENSTPFTMAAKFHCKVIDGILEGSLFAFMASYAVLTMGLKDRSNNCTDPLPAFQWQIQALYCCAFYSFASVGFAIMEIDHRFSDGVHELLTRSSRAQLSHLVFRVSEAVLHILTLVVWCIAMSVWYWWLGPALVACDYLIGLLLLLYTNGGRMSPRTLLAMPLLTVPITVSNLVIAKKYLIVKFKTC